MGTTLKNTIFLFIGLFMYFSYIIIYDLPKEYVTTNISNIDCMNKEEDTIKLYDYIVIGAGTSGCVVASQLSLHNYSVLLIEEGGWSSEWDVITNSKSAFETAPLYKQVWMNLKTKRDYKTIKQINLDNRIIDEPRGKVTGGSGSIHGLNHLLGQINDFDIGWNIKNWKWNDLKYIWNNINNTFKYKIAGNKNDIWIKRFINSAQLNNYTFIYDPNNVNENNISHISIRRYSINPLNGLRESTWTAYIEPILSNKYLKLDIKVHTRVNKILFNSKNKIDKIETYGIYNKKIKYFKAKNEIILSAGVIDTPKILMLSGIGDCNYLESIGINCIMSIPAIGQNLISHLSFRIYSPPLKDQSIKLMNENSNIIAMRKHGKYHIFMDLVNKNNITCIKITLGILKPESRGKILLKNNNPEIDPIIDPNYFSDKRDEKIFIDGFKDARQLLYSSILKPLYENNTDEIKPGFKTDNDNKLIKYAKKNIFSYAHPTSTCKMGNQFNKTNIDDIVVNNKLQVRGMKGLRIIDASIVPNTVSAGTNAMAILIGFKGSEIILND